MKFITGKDRDQLEICSLNQVISEENEVRLIDLFLQAVDLADFGFKMEFIENGRPAPLFIINFAINSFALSMFIPMLQGAYPTILPHLIVLLTIPILIVQLKMYKKY